jgi:hypothetical protein
MRVQALIVTNVHAMLTVSVMTENRATGNAPCKHLNLFILQVMNVQNNLKKKRIIMHVIRA